MLLWIIHIFVTTEVKSFERGQGYSIEKYEASPGLYYELLGETTLYNSEWKTIVYVNLKETDSQTEQLGQYINHVNKLCKSTEVQNWTDCNHFESLSRDRFRQLQETERVLDEIIGKPEKGRSKRGALNFVGEVSKILFGTLDADDAEYYNAQIKHFEEESEDMASMLKQQLSIVKASLGTVNATMSDMEYNNRIIKDGVTKLKGYMEKFATDTKTQLDIINVKIIVEGHIAHVNHAMDAIQRNLNLLIESVLNAQKGILQPQIVSVRSLMETLQKSASKFPKDTMAPFTLSKDSSHLLLKICDVHIYMKDGILSYVISLPLVNRGIFKTYRVLPLPVEVEQRKFVYTESGNEILCIDQTRQYYFLTSREELRLCKVVQAKSYLCKQNQPLLNSHMQEACAVKLLLPRVSIPKICDVRVVHVEHTIWTQLEQRNEWIYFTPFSDSVTIVCSDREPVEIQLRGTGKLSVNSGCKGYSLTALLNTKSEFQANYTGKGEDLLSKVQTQFECCEQFGTSVNLSHIELDMRLKPTLTNMEDLKYASYRISELEKLATEQEWKRKHFQYHNTYSVLMYITVTIIVLYGLYRLVKWVITRWKNCRMLKQINTSSEQKLSLPMGTSGTGNVINIKIKTSNESLAMNPEAIPLQEIGGGSGNSSPRQPRRSSRIRKTYF
jgi:hypothetical protein